MPLTQAQRVTRLSSAAHRLVDLVNLSEIKEQLEEYIPADQLKLCYDETQPMNVRINALLDLANNQTEEDDSIYMVILNHIEEKMLGFRRICNILEGASRNDPLASDNMHFLMSQRQFHTPVNTANKSVQVRLITCEAIEEKLLDVEKANAILKLHTQYAKQRVMDIKLAVQHCEELLSIVSKRKKVKLLNANEVDSLQDAATNLSFTLSPAENDV